MLIFIYGDDTFRTQEKAQEMESRFKEKFDPSSMNSARFDAKSPIGDVMQAVQSSPFLGEKRLTVIRDLATSLKKADAESWVEGFKKTPDTSIVIFWESADVAKVEKTELFKALQKEKDTHLYSFPLLQSGELTRWVTDRAATMKMQIDRMAINELVTRVGDDLWRMNQELEKLSAFAGGEPVTIENIREMIHASFEDQMFDFIDAVSQQNIKKALQLLDEERQSGAEEFHLLSMLTRQVRILLGARALLDENPRATKQELASTMSLHPFAAQKAMQQAQSFTLENLKQVHDLLYRYDLGLKTGQIKPEMAVDLVVAKLTG